MSEFSDRLKRLFEATGQTQGWLAARFNERASAAVTSATIGRWINGVNEPKLEWVPHLADVLKVPAAYLAFGHRDAQDVTPSEEATDAMARALGMAEPPTQKPAGRRRRA